MWKAVLFDLDGTLADTLNDIASAMNRALRLNGLPEWPVESYKTLVGNGADILAQRAVRDRQDCRAAVRAEYQQWYERHTLDTTAPYPGIPQLLAALKAHGLRLCVFSNKPHADTVGVVSALFPAGTFDLIRGQVPQVPVKPAPDGALYAAQALNLAPEDFLYLGDTSTDMQCARAAGMFPVGVSWGFRTREELEAAGAAVIIDHPMALLQLLAGEEVRPHA